MIFLMFVIILLINILKLMMNIHLKWLGLIKEEGLLVKILLVVAKSRFTAKNIRKKPKWVNYFT